MIYAAKGENHNAILQHHEDCSRPPIKNSHYPTYKSIYIGMGDYNSYSVLSYLGYVNRVFEIMVSTKKNEEAVSPVIGVILMVAVTVILAAIISAFVFGMAGNIQTSKDVGVTLTRNSSSFGVLTIQGGTSLSQLSEINYTVNGGAETQFSPVATSPSAGKTYGTKGVAGVGDVPASTRVIIIGHFTDGSNQILVDKQF